MCVCVCVCVCHLMHGNGIPLIRVDYVWHDRERSVALGH